jgi:hypothetical protein
MHNHEIVRFAVIVLFSIFSSTSLSSAQTYKFVRVAADNMTRPDGAGPFGIYSDIRPCVEGDWVVFRDPGFFGSVKKQSIWSYNIADGSYIRLVDQETPAPGGTGNFSDLFYDTQPVLKNGIVTFLARDDKPGIYNQGIYTIPVGGGPISLVANYNTPDPSGGTFVNFDMSGKPFGGFSVAQSLPSPDDPTVMLPGRIVFYGRNEQNIFGLYSALPDGSDLRLIADVRSPVHPRSVFPVSIFFNGAPSGDRVVFYGQTVFDPSTGFNALYTSPVTGPDGVTEDGSPNFQEILNSDRHLPDNPNEKFHTRVNVPSLQADGDAIAFVADDTNSDFRGIFTMPLSGGDITPVVTPFTSLEGLGTLETRYGFLGLTLNQGRVLFHAYDRNEAGPANQGMFVWQDGVHKRIIGTGDKIGEDVVTNILQPGVAAMSGDRVVVLLTTRPSGNAIFVAIPEEPPPPSEVGNK